MKQIIIGVLAVAAILGGAILFGKKDTNVNGVQSSHIYGNEQSTVTLVEYGDFECPACYGFFPLVKQIKEEYKDRLRFEFRNFPLVQVHQHALAAHRAAEAASKQGKFWEMHDILYQRQEDWNGPSQTDPTGIPIGQAITMFEGYAKELGLNVDQFKSDVEATDTLGIINADLARGGNEKVNATPTFFLNGKKIEDSNSIDTIDEFRKLIDDALGTTQDSDNSAATPTAAPTQTPETVTPTAPPTQEQTTTPQQ